jgi:hypothetical protein
MEKISSRVPGSNPRFPNIPKINTKYKVQSSSVITDTVIPDSRIPDNFPDGSREDPIKFRLGKLGYTGRGYTGRKAPKSASGISELDCTTARFLVIPNGITPNR